MTTLWHGYTTGQTDFFSAGSALLDSYYFTDPARQSGVSKTFVNEQGDAGYSPPGLTGAPPGCRVATEGDGFCACVCSISSLILLTVL